MCRVLRTPVPTAGTPPLAATPSAAARRGTGKACLSQRPVSSPCAKLLHSLRHCAQTTERKAGRPLRHKECTLCASAPAWVVASAKEVRGGDNLLNHGHGHSMQRLLWDKTQAPRWAVCRVHSDWTYLNERPRAMPVLKQHDDAAAVERPRCFSTLRRSKNPWKRQHCVVRTLPDRHSAKTRHLSRKKTSRLNLLDAASAALRMSRYATYTSMALRRLVISLTSSSAAMSLFVYPNSPFNLIL